MSLGRLRLRRPNQFRSGGGLLAAGITAAWLIGAGSGFAQPASQQKPLLSDQYFKNVKALKGIPVDDFMETMGIISAALRSTVRTVSRRPEPTKSDWAADTPSKVIARTMINMVARRLTRTTSRAAKRSHAGPAIATATNHWSRLCSRPSTASRPWRRTTLSLQRLGCLLPIRFWIRFIQASGGAQRLAGLTSIDATGTSAGFGGFGGGGAVEIAAKSPDKRSTIILFKAETGRGDQIRTYDGNTGWVRTPLSISGEFQLIGERSGWGQVRCSVVFSWADQADSHEFEEPAIQPRLAIFQPQKANRRCRRISSWGKITASKWYRETGHGDFS